MNSTSVSSSSFSVKIYQLRSCVIYVNAEFDALSLSEQNVSSRLSDAAPASIDLNMIQGRISSASGFIFESSAVSGPGSELGPCPRSQLSGRTCRLCSTRCGLPSVFLSHPAGPGGILSDTEST